MKKLLIGILVVVILITGIVFTSCGGSNAQQVDNKLVNEQQKHYSIVQPLPSFDYSIPRDILIQIYEVVTTEARNTYTVITSMTGQVLYHGASLGYGIPVDTQLTNPLMARGDWSDSPIIEQPEPNGLFSSKNTDGTWVLFVDNNGDVTPIYTEQKVTTFPFAVKQLEDGSWTRADDIPSSFTIEIKD